jgi:hypothetical protein
MSALQRVSPAKPGLSNGSRWMKCRRLLHVWPFALQKSNPIVRNFSEDVRVYHVIEMNTNVPRSIAFAYPGFQALPRGIKKMLVLTETFFFGEEKERSVADLRLPSAGWQPPAGMDRAHLSFWSSWTN